MSIEEVVYTNVNLRVHDYGNGDLSIEDKRTGVMIRVAQSVKGLRLTSGYAMIVDVHNGGMPAVTIQEIPLAR